MVAILAVFAVLLLAGLFIFLRSAGRLGQQPAPDDRMRHNGSASHHSHPRAPGLD